MPQAISPAAGAPAGRAMAQAYLALAAAALFWGGNWAVARWIQYQVPPQTLGLLRWGMAALLLAPFALPATIAAWPVIRREWPRLVVFGFIGVTGFSALSYTGLAYTTAINGSLLNSAAPVFLFLFAALGFGGERIGVAEVAGVAVSLAGVLVIVSRGDPAVLAALSINIGDLWVLAAVLLWGVYTVLLKRWPSALSPRVFLFATIMASLPLPIVTSAIELTLGGRTVGFDLTTAVVGVYLGLFPSIAAYACWAYGVARVGPTRAILFQYLIPVFAAGLAIVLLDEEVRLFHIAGAALIIGGLFIAARKRPS